MENKKSYIGIKNSVDDSTLELFFTDYIFDGFDWNTFEATNMVQDMIDKIKAANPSKIKVTINSLGGDVMIGLAIYNFLKNYNAKVQVEIIGFAASIASIIAMSASKGKLMIAKNGFMIIHAASSFAAGNAKELRDQAEVLDKISTEMADIYALRSGKDAKYFTDLWADGGDVWLTGAEAKEMGLADELINATAMTAKLNLEDFGYKNIPKKITSSIIQNQKLNMAFKKTIAASKAESFAVVDGGFLLEETQLNNIENALTVAETAAGEAAATLASVNASLEEKNASLVALTEEVAAQKKIAETLTAEKAAAAQKLTETETAHATALAAKDEKIASLEAEVVTLGKKPSGTGSAVVSTEDEKPEEAATGKPGLLDAEHPLNKYAANKIANAAKTHKSKI